LLQQQPAAELIGVVDPLPEARARVAEQLNVPAVAEWDQLPQNPHAAIIATPSSLHYEIAQPLIRQGIHLLIEKPVTVELQQASILAGLARRCNTTIAVGHVERFNPAWQGIADRIGRVAFIEAHRTSGYTFRSTDIGVVLDLMIHDLDLIAELVDSEPERIDAWGAHWLSPDEDIASARIQFRCGAVAQLAASRCSPEATRKIWLVGERGQATLNLATRQVDVVEISSQAAALRECSGPSTAAERARARDAVFTSTLPHHRWQPEAGNAILEEQRDWLQAIRDGRPPRVDVQSACRSLAWAEQIRLAIGTAAAAPASPPRTRAA
jgi:predicted dehydrogenase